MSEHRDNLLLAAKLLDRIYSDTGLPEFEGVEIRRLAAECRVAAGRAKIDEIREEILTGSFACNPGESAGMAEVIELHGWSKKAPCA